MKKDDFGRLIIKVTVSGCGIGLEGVTVRIFDREGIQIKQSRTQDNGCTSIINFQRGDAKEYRSFFDVEAECVGYDTLVCRNVPVTYGYLSIWNMPLEKRKNE